MIETLYDCFKHWSEKGSVYIYSDPHFADEEMKYLRKNYIGDEEQIARINSVAHKNDTLIILGDCGDLDYIDRLKAGYKVLVMGNHDESIKEARKHFDEVYSGALIIAQKIMLSHEPLYVKGVMNNHGHDHSYREIYCSSEYTAMAHMNLCAERIDYTPFNLGKFIKEGGLSHIDSIHRLTIDNATQKKEKNLYLDFWNLIFPEEEGD